MTPDFSSRPDVRGKSPNPPGEISDGQPGAFQSYMFEGKTGEGEVEEGNKVKL
jgi:hypothetical protein